MYIHYHSNVSAKSTACRAMSLCDVTIPIHVLPMLPLGNNIDDTVGESGRIGAGKLVTACALYCHLNNMDTAAECLLTTCSYTTHTHA